MSKLPSFLYLPNASKPMPTPTATVVDLSPSSQFSYTDMHADKKSTTLQEKMAYKRDSIANTVIANNSNSDCDDKEWQCLKATLMKIGFTDSVLQAMEKDCPNFDTLYSFITLFEKQKRQILEQNVKSDDLKKQLANLRESMSMRDLEHEVTMKRLKQAESDMGAQKARADRIDASLKKEREDRARMAQELGRRDLELMDVKSKLQQATKQAAPTVAAKTADSKSLEAANKNLELNQLALQKEIHYKESEIKELQDQCNELTMEVAKVKSDAVKATDQLKSARVAIDNLKKQNAQLKDDIAELKHSALYQMESLKKSHERHLKEVAAKMSPTSSCASEVDSEKVRKLEEILRLQRQVSTKFQEQNQALREELNIRKFELAALYEEKVQLEQQNNNHVHGCFKEEPAESPAFEGAFMGGLFEGAPQENEMPAVVTDVKYNSKDSKRNGFLPQSKRGAEASRLPEKSTVIMTPDRSESSRNTEDSELRWPIISSDGVVSNDLAAYKIANQQLRRKLSERTDKIFDLQSELAENQSGYQSLVKQLKAAKQEIDEKDEYVITLRRRLRQSENNKRLLEGGDAAASSSNVDVSIDQMLEPPQSKVLRLGYFEKAEKAESVEQDDYSTKFRPLIPNQQQKRRNFGWNKRRGSANKRFNRGGRGSKR